MLLRSWRYLRQHTYPADFLLENLKIQAHVIETAWRFGVRRLLFLGSDAFIPSSQTNLLKKKLFAGALEPTNEFYAIAKIAGIKLCESLRYQRLALMRLALCNKSLWTW